jgi:hypothetical protein
MIMRPALSARGVIESTTDHGLLTLHAFRVLFA